MCLCRCLQKRFTDFNQWTEKNSWVLPKQGHLYSVRIPTPSCPRPVPASQGKGLGAVMFAASAFRAVLGIEAHLEIPVKWLNTE